jgi:hypothetical protein
VPAHGKDVFKLQDELDDKCRRTAATIRQWQNTLPVRLYVGLTLDRS